MSETKVLCEEKLGNLWKSVRHPVFQHFLSWRVSMEETKKRERDHQIAKAHQLGHAAETKVFFFETVSVRMCEVEHMFVLHPVVRE